MATTIDPVTPQLKAARRWIDAYNTLDINEIDGLFPKNYKHLTLPKSMGLPEETKEEYLQRYGGFLSVFTKFETTYHDVTEVPGKVIIHATNRCSTIYGVPLIYEGVFTLHFIEEDGELRLTRCKEFIDSQGYATFVAKIAEVVAEGVPAS